MIEEEIPEGFEFVKNKSNANFEEKDGKYILETDVIEPGETKEYTVHLNWVSDEKNKGEKQNIARIISTQNNPDFEETTLEDNADKVVIEIEIDKTIKDVVEDLVEGVTTGDTIMIYIGTFILAGIVLVLSSKKIKKQ